MDPKPSMKLAPMEDCFNVALQISKNNTNNNKRTHKTNNKIAMDQSEKPLAVGQLAVAVDFAVATLLQLPAPPSPSLLFES
jgi:hypothetical protein